MGEASVVCAEGKAMSNKIKSITIELTEEQSRLFDDMYDRLKTLNDNGRLGLCIAQVHWKNGRVRIVAGLVEDEERAVKICLSAGVSKSDIALSRRRARFGY